MGVSGSQRAALKLSAGSPCDLTASDENDVVNVNAVPRSNGEPDDIGARVDLHAVARLAHDDESLFRIMRGTDGGARRNVTIRVENRAFDVQRIMVLAAKNQELFETPCDEELAFAHEAQIAGAQERPFSVVETTAKRCFRFLGAPPIAVSDACTAHPNLANREGGELPERLRIYDAHVQPWNGRPAADDAAHTFPIGLRELRATRLES